MADETGLTPEDYDHAPPSPGAMLEALRGLGYSPETALADLIDNSIAAGATRVSVEFLWAGPASIIRITDNGRGMDARTLINAMRPASRHPLAIREATDLGRFGLGLKTASLSQGRVLGVVTRAAGGPLLSRCWDLDYVAQVDAWRLRDLPEELADHAVLPVEAAGTIILIGQLDRLLGADADGELAARRFQSAARQVERHLAMTFHRFLEDSRLELLIGGGGTLSRIRPWDPFLTQYPATTSTPVERLQSAEGTVTLQGFVLPHPDRLTADQFEEGSGPEGWLAHQGFFVYRHQRLLQAGGWLGLGGRRGWVRDEVHRLARIRLDLPNTADSTWKVDIRKSTAVPPTPLRPRLQGLTEQIRRDAREVFTWRGGRSSRTTRPAIVRIWNAVETHRGNTYRIDRAHPSVQRALDAAGTDRRLIEEMLIAIEGSLPVQRIWLDTVENGQIADRPVGMPLAEADAMRSLFNHMRSDLGLTVDEARRRLLQIEPFARYPAAVAELR